MTHLTNAQMHRLLELAKVRDVRLYAMILLGWRHGLRASEIIGLRAGDFDMVGGFLTVSRLKGSLRTTQQLFADELTILPHLLEGKGPTDFVFPGRKAGRSLSYWSFWDQFKGLCRDLELPSHLCHPHVLKHSTGMTVIKQGIENCRQYLGHKSIASTGAYLRVSDAEASRAAMAAFGD
jgi:type 1 fimbriae regulatory protein FimB